MKKSLLVGMAVALATAVTCSSALGATRTSSSPAATPGVTSSSITIGGTFPMTGVASLYAPIPRGMATYFNFINARKGPDGKKGVYGRKIDWKYYDDAYNPAQTVQLTNQLILQDKVFAIVGSLGTEHNQAIRPILNQRHIPQIFVATGASYWGLQYKDFPWTIGWQPDYIAEGIAYGRWIVANAPNAKIAVLFQNDDYGKDYLRGLKIGLARKTNLIVSEQSYEITDTSYASQIARQKASGADTWVLLTTPTPTVRAIATAKALNWKPGQIVINSVSAIDTVMAAAVARAGADFVAGSISTTYLKNVTNPAYGRDPWVRQYRKLVAKYGPAGVEVNNENTYYGVAKAYDIVKTLYLAGKHPTRNSLMAATLKMNWINPYTIKGVKVKTGKADHFPLSQVRLIRYGNGSWSEFGPLIKGR